MAVERKDEILGKAVASDATNVPRYTGKDETGAVKFQHIALILENPVTQEGMPYDKIFADEVLAASGVAQGNGVLTLDQPNYTINNGYAARFQILNQIAGPTTLSINNTEALRVYSHEWADPEYYAPGTWVSVVCAIHPDTGEKAYILQGGGGGRGPIHLFSELDDIQICAGRFTNKGSGWNSFTFPREFDGIPALQAQLVGVEGFVLFNNITKTGFQYQVRLPSVSITPTTGTYYTAAGTAASSTHSAVTLVSAVSGAASSVATASAYEIAWQAIYDGGVD